MRIRLVLSDGTVNEGRATAVGREIAIGRGVHVTVKGNISSIGNYEEDDLIAYDAEDKSMHMLSVSSQGMVRDRVGNWRDDRTLELHWAGTAQGQRAEEHLVLSFRSERELHIRDVENRDGQPYTVADYDLTRSSKREIAEESPAFA